MNTQQGFHNLDLTGFFVILLILGAVAGAFAMWIIPIGWEWIKPFIHEVTK